MSAHPPPVPPEQQRQDGKTPEGKSQKKPEEYGSRNRNLEEQGRQGNINQNTHNQGYQQDR
ncbi:MAG: hypothetical protein AB7F35_07645 [Acetobacteraceae bacterium]